MQSVVRQVAYGTLSRRDRKAIHLAVAWQLENRRTRGPTSIAAVIAQHYLDALDAVPDAPDSADLTSRAITWLRRAAARAGALGSPNEASGHLLTALARVIDPDVRALMEFELPRRSCRPAGTTRRSPTRRPRPAAFGEVEDSLATARAAVVLARAHSALGDNEGALRLLEPHYESLRSRADAARSCSSSRVR